ncbi:MAG TPA: hypothetical protein VHZ25_14845 [Acidobacteriaceae bacterium]|nr:hypothetical protein [Acidobacteriaceae bacterium]
MKRAWRGLGLMAGVLSLSMGSGGGNAESAGDFILHVTRQCDHPVLTIQTQGAEGNKYGFEGGRVIKLGTTYHLFTSEMVGDPHWVKMKLAHWISPDRAHWTRRGTLFESSGDFTGQDRRAALWSPMPVFDPAADRWNLFYVAYQAAPDTSQEWRTNHEGRIWRAVSGTPGIDGIDGPYTDAGIVLERGSDSDPWEGLQGTDSFFPYRAAGKWYALYGSAHTERLPISLWQVGLASAPDLKGPWRRCTEANPLHVEPRFIENPIVTQLAGGTYVAVYDNHQPDEVGYAVSQDGVHWTPGRHLVVQSGNGVWATEVRTPLGLVDEGNGAFTLFYTANQKVPGAQADPYGVTLTPGALGFVEVRRHRTVMKSGAQAEFPSNSVPVKRATSATDPDKVRLLGATICS